ncbi:hypothetical protein MishRS11D_25830 [Methylomagnum ishizawai]|nr:hypothetical protein MishRS11D_25830 [Methylomagnum ishizawai]
MAVAAIRVELRHFPDGQAATQRSLRYSPEPRYNDATPNPIPTPTVPDSPSYDLLISHTPAHSPAVRPLLEALRPLGVSYRTAPARECPELPPGFGLAKACLVWASEDYFQSRAAQTQLAAAYLAQDRDAAPAARRLLLVNAAAGTRHIYPVPLRDWRYAIAPEPQDASGHAALAAALRAHCAGLAEPLAQTRPPTAPPWYAAHQARPEPTLIFLRRERELWDIHALLDPAPTPATAEPGPVVAVAGIEGQGKSTLAREYAHRFGPAFPGGIFWLTAREAKPIASVADLAENPPLKMQLLAFLHALSPQDPTPPTADTPTLLDRLGSHLAEAGQPFLWIVDDLPEGLNGPAFQQWLAPAAPLGRTLLTTRSQRYDEQVECIHLPPLDEETAWHLLTWNLPPTSGPERAATARLLDELGRQPLAITAANAAARGNRRQRNAPYTALRRRLGDPAHGAVIVASNLHSGLPKAQETALAGALLAAMSAMGEAGHDLLRLAANLADAPLPVDFVVDCLAGSGLCEEPQRQHPLRARCLELLGIPQPSAAELAHRHAGSGIAALDRLGLGEVAGGSLHLHSLTIHAMRIANHDLRRLAALHRAAVGVLHDLAGTCAAAGDWRRLAALAPHARALTADPREHSAQETQADLAHRARLAAFLGDMDMAHGLPQRALEMYRHAGAGLARAVAADAEAWDWLADLARVRECTGDILSARGDAAGALDTYLKSLRIRKRLTAQDPGREDWQLGQWSLYLKAGEALAQGGDLDKARNSYRAGLTQRSALPPAALADGEREYALAAAFERLAGLYRKKKQAEAALDALKPALEIYQKLAGPPPSNPKFAPAPARVHGQLAEILRERGETQPALEHYRQAIAAYTQLSGQDSANLDWKRQLAQCHRWAGEISAAQSQPEEAIKHYRARTNLLKRLISPGPPDAALQREIAVNYAKLGLLCDQTGDSPTALGYYRKALAGAAQWAELVPDDHSLHSELAWVEQRLAQEKTQSAA